jgi:carboxypeptidase C (cathepsin A)
MTKYIWSLIFIFTSIVIQAAETPKEEKKEGVKDVTEIKDDFIETIHEVKINGIPLSYKAVAGTLVLKQNETAPEASIFFVSYTKEGNTNTSNRPITFCFNGGPGSSSVWIHLGAFGPKRVLLNDQGEALPPYRLIDNEFCLLDQTDLVFIDPVSTGFSRAVAPTEPKSFHGYDEDIKSVAEFIRLYLSRFNRWDSPKFLSGESYGTTRAVGLANYLHNESYIYMDGIIMISAVLDFQALDFDNCSDLGYISFLPSYAATAWYYKRLAPDLQSDFSRTLNEVRQFIQNEYAPALFKGDQLSESERKKIIEKLVRYTALPAKYWEEGNLRIEDQVFMKKFLAEQGKTVGRFDSRYSGYSLNPLSNSMEYDPSAENIIGAYTATFNQYVRENLKYDKLINYRILTNVFPWNFGSKGNNQYLQVCSSLKEVMIKNPHLEVFIANGYYDLATPYYSTEYAVNHLRLPGNLSKHIHMYYYEAGHMMYAHQPSLVKFKSDLNAFYKISLDKKRPVMIVN